MGWSVARSSKISRETVRWPSVRVKGSRASNASRRHAGGGLAGDGGQLGVRVPAAGQRDLEDERLVPLEPVAGVGHIGLAAGAVDPLEGVGQVEQAPSLAQGGGQRVDGVPGAGQDGVHGLGDLPVTPAWWWRQIGMRAPAQEPTASSALFAAQQLVRRVGELEPAVEQGHLAGEHRAGAGQEVLVGLVDALAEEDELEPPLPSVMVTSRRRPSPGPL